MTNLLILSRDAARYEALIARHPAAGSLQISSPNDCPPADILANAEIVLGEPALVAPCLAQMPALKWVQSTFAGIEPFCRDGLRRDYQLTGIKGIFGPLMSEYVFGNILARERRIGQLAKQQEAKIWQPNRYRGLAGLTMGICGLGSIGQQIAATAKALGMRTLGWKRTPGPAANTDETFSGDQLAAMAARCDFLVSVLPDTPATQGLFNRALFEGMKGEALFINVGRGSAVVEEDLVQALEKRVIGGAVLDVFRQEPLPQDSPLWDCPGLVITPHCAAESFPEDIARIFLGNLERWKRGQALEYLVDFERGY
ncbi:D-2-hydroxyacid dehydrogenase [Biformimicrobium ophioploci]|uniref:D-2-hydroxyacid dehydrogenase n=1 Tax=Biformimicrobium ophioploci TaxID=3036711 RepID=A0ABQ6LZF2_9GAMM|nr:D-2-hydroxyacid dehydrogenase [Microbulbifer sp. NKW57]GMG87439.1 D-2-hydroxyacid dehydrogenase [Microbulbifer sp. NKW57]